MTSKDAYDIAAKIVDLSFKNLSLFITICSLLSGWMLLKETALTIDLTSRLYLAIIFSSATVTMIYGQVSLLRRANAALAIAESTFAQENDAQPIPQDQTLLFLRSGLFPTVVAMGFVVIFVNFIVLTHRLGEPTKSVAKPQVLHAVSMLHHVPLRDLKTID